ncbi:hypothetical protein BaRGS_00034058 [Batillaria attramentaria]|uniref:Calcineurin-like phosphoesterase domain-containing protein n=1 Tax=Batillaria attramentaria TaxID=370345 RepID=A0ABD0JJ00_9CAEN
MKYLIFRLRKSTIMKAFLLIVATVTFAAILWASLRDALDPNLFQDDVPVRKARDHTWPRMDDRPDGIFWMVQVTDIHISKFRDLKRGPDLVRFCKDYLPIIQPQLVLVTGDLTDAKDAGNIKSKQYEEEWHGYQQAIKQCQTFSNATFLDTRGNHDAFDVPELDGDGNFFRKYSVMGKQHALSYHYKHETDFGRYSFIVVDACPIPGVRRPFNFFGILDSERVQQLANLDVESRGSNLTIWMGHYPTSLIVQDPPGVRNTMRNAVAYLCGHLHTLGGLVPQMYSRQKTGTLELELGDWKENRIFRVLAVDHDLLSFVDGELGEWPLILVTNPKHSLFLASRHEPTETIQYSSHISQRPVVGVEIFIDSAHVGQARQSKGPLYTLPWKPELYSLGLHTIRVQVKDDTGYMKSVEQPFSVDGSQPSFAFWPRFLLMMNIFTVSKVAFGVLVFCYVLLLASLRQGATAHVFYIAGNNFLVRWFNSWVRRLWLAARINSVYYTLLMFLLYITFGPWFVGDFMSDHMGVLFVWGTFVKGTFLPGSLTFIYGVFQVLTFNVPLTLIVGLVLDLRREEFNSRFDASGLVRLPRRRLLVAELPFSLLLVFQTYIAVKEFPTSYGTTALIVSPVRVGSLLVAVLLLYLAHAAPIKKACLVNESSDD